MAAHLDDMFSFCVDPGKAAACVEVRFIDNIKVRWFRFSQINRFRQSCVLNWRCGGEAVHNVDHSQAEQRLLVPECHEGAGLCMKDLWPDQHRNGWDGVQSYQKVTGLEVWCVLFNRKWGEKANWQHIYIIKLHQTCLVRPSQHNPIIHVAVIEIKQEIYLTQEPKSHYFTQCNFGWEEIQLSACLSFESCNSARKLWWCEGKDKLNKHIIIYIILCNGLE